MTDESNPIILNSDQKNAEAELFKFLLSEERYMSLSGRAGTGKSTLLKYLINQIIPRYTATCTIMGRKPLISEVELCASTNKAADNLSDDLGITARTIHSVMGLKVSEDYETGKQRITKGRNFQVYSNMLVIIDEAGMVDRTTFKYFNDAFDHTCKLLFTGDVYQLAPVGEELSLTFATPMRNAELLQPMRNASQPHLIALCEQFRETVRTGVFKPIHFHKGVVDHLNGAEFKTEVSQTFQQEGADARILGYTNDKVKSYNTFIRSLRNRPEEFQTGERVVNNSAIDLGRQGMIHAEKEFLIERPSTGTITMQIREFSLEAYAVNLLSPRTKSLAFSVYQAKDPVFLKDLIKWFGKQKMWPEMFKLKGMFPDLRTRDASTVHKAQGSTFEQVYVDLTNIGKVTVSTTAARMLYVAVSRPRNRIAFYGRLPDRYLGG